MADHPDSSSSSSSIKVGAETPSGRKVKNVAAFQRWRVLASALVQRELHVVPQSVRRYDGFALLPSTRTNDTSDDSYETVHYSIDDSRALAIRQRRQQTSVSLEELSVADNTGNVCTSSHGSLISIALVHSRRSCSRAKACGHRRRCLHSTAYSTPTCFGTIERASE